MVQLECDNIVESERAIESRYPNIPPPVLETRNTPQTLASGSDKIGKVVVLRGDSVETQGVKSPGPRSTYPLPINGSLLKTS